jgi:tripartite-type tricarboxylate transporter receptor subunit TctC
MKRNIIAAAAALGTAIALAGCSTAAGTGGDDAPADDYPTRNITLIVPYPAGSGPDGWARVVAQELEGELGVSVIVENREGGASTIGLYELANTEPDGYTLGVGSFSGISLQSRLIDNPFEGIDTLTPVAQTKTPPFLLFTSPGSGYDSIEDFIDDAKAHPGEITVAVPNQNSIPDVLIHLLEESAGIDLEQVYYDAGQQVLPVVNGTADVGIAQAGPVVQFVETGELGWIGTFGSTPAPGLDVPLFDDEGYDTSRIADFEGIFAPAGLPDSVVERLSAAIKVATESDAFQELLAKTYNSSAFMAGAEFAEHARAADKEAAALIDELGLAK